MSTTARQTETAAIFATSATAVLLVALIITLAVATAQQATTAARTAAKVPRPRGYLAGGGEAGVPAGYAGGSETRIKVIPLTWTSNGALYMVSFVVGRDVVEAAFDTGSARFIVATKDCSNCTSSKYNPETSPTAYAIVDPRKDGRTVAEPLRPDQILNGEHQDILCSDMVSYVSQHNNIVMYSDTVTFPRYTVDGASICDNTSIDDMMAEGSRGPAPPLTVTNYPIGGITTTSGDSSLNVFGMSGVRSVTKVGTQYLLPSCQVSPTPAYESATIQAIALYYNARKQDVVWSQYIGVETGFMVFGSIRSLQLRCIQDQVQYVGMVPQLKFSTNPIDNTRWRFYVLRVESITVDGVQQPSDRTPAMFIFDTGSTQTMLPGASGVTAGVMSAARTSVVITFYTKAKPGQAVTQRASLRYDVAAGETKYGVPDLSSRTGQGFQPVFVGMPNNVAQIFSSKMDVGLLGVTAMRNTYVEYDLTNLRLGFMKSM